MAKDLEKANKVLEKQNKKLKKKNKKAGVIILVLLLILALLFLVVFLFDPLGFGNGMGILLNDKTGDQRQLPLETAASTEEQPTEPEINYIDVTVSGSTYLIGKDEKTVDDIVKTAQDTENSVVRIKDDDATVNAMQALTDALEAQSIAYSEINE